MFDLFAFVYYYTRPLIKWFLRKFTRLCELQRICYGSEFGACRYKDVERSLELSRTPDIIALLTLLNSQIELDVSVQVFDAEVVPHAVRTVLYVKQIKPKIHPDFAKIFASCLQAIWGYRRLYQTIERIRITTYDCNNYDHEQKLLRLWDLLMPEQKLESRVTKQWQDIGFQGDNPMSDFRGMGLLGLDNLLFFAEEYNGAARHVLSHSLHPRHGYTFAIVGINLTSMAYTLLKTGIAKTHIFNLNTTHPTIDHFHKFYCYLFFEFDKYWMECKPASLMDFSSIHDKFQNSILTKLADNRTVFKLNFSVDDI